MSEGQSEAKSQVCEAARKADVSFFDGEGLNPLMHAARLDHADVVKILLETDVPWNALFPSNLSAGDFAMDSGRQEAFEVLYKFFFLGHLFPLLTSTSCCLDVEVSHHNNSSSTSKSLLSMYRSFILNLTMGPHRTPLSSTTIFSVEDATVSLTTTTRTMS
ncbi:hypothetical protein AAG906_009071 [Vitis piasezkii]